MPCFEFGVVLELDCVAGADKNEAGAVVDVGDLTEGDAGSAGAAVAGLMVLPAGFAVFGCGAGRQDEEEGGEQEDGFHRGD